MTPEERAGWNGYIDASRGIERSFWQPTKRKKHLTSNAWWVVLLIVALVCWFAIRSASAHVPGHAEWDDVLGASTNQQGTSCCGLGDAHLLEFDEWRETAKGYEVFIEGAWHAVQKWKISTNQVNPTSKAIVWYSTYDGNEGMMHSHGLAVYCFRPLNTY